MSFPPSPFPRESEAPAAEETHKARSVWFRERAAYPYREADPDPLVQHRIDRRAKGASPHSWVALGPSNIAGRFTSLAIHRDHPDTIFAGAAGGGVWRSDDGGDTWKSLWSDQETLNIGSLAVDPLHPDTVYCGTGEANLSSDLYPGSGFYMSTDRGEHWTHVLATSGSDLVPRRIGSLSVKTITDPNEEMGATVCIYLGSVTHADDDISRLMKVLLFPDGRKMGQFDPTFISGLNYWVHAVMAHPSGHVFAAIQARGSLSGIWRSDTKGGNFQHLQKGLPSGDRFGRVSLAFAPSKPSVLYALAENLHRRVLGVFRSRNLGDSWEPISGDHFKRELQASYNNCIAVDPDDHRTVYCGLLDLHRTRDGGRNWERITNRRLKPGHRQYVHCDFHAIAIPVHNRLYVATDGGIFRSDNGGNSWRDLNDGLQTTMFYDIDVAPGDGHIYGGGTQDNGTLVHTGATSKSKFKTLARGDGGWTIFDPDDPFHLWASSQHMFLQRLHNGRWAKVTPRGATTLEKNAVWLSFLAMDCSRSRRRPRTVFAGTSRVWRTTSDGRSWDAVTRPLDNTIISAIEVASADPRFVYVGTTRGGFFRSTDGGDTWSEDLAGPELPGRIITRIESHPEHPKLVVVTVGLTPRDRRIIVQLPERGGSLAAGTSRFSHVFVSRDAGLNWVAADFLDVRRRQLPDVPFNSVSFETRPPFRVFLASDAGVFVGQLPDAATRLASGDMAEGEIRSFREEQAEVIGWEDITGGLPNAPVTDIVYHHETEALFVSTFGRGVWHLKLGT